VASEEAQALYGKILNRNMGALIDACNEIEDGVFVGGATGMPEVDAYLNLQAERPQVLLSAKSNLWLPITDSQQQKIDNNFLSFSVNFIEQCKAIEWTILIGCAAGISRSGMVIMAYVMKEHGFPLEDAWEYVNAKRAICPNPGFLDALIGWEKYLAHYFEGPGR
jgi:protein-tyrosine phosphatase